MLNALLSLTAAVALIAMAFWLFRSHRRAFGTVCSILAILFLVQTYWAASDVDTADSETNDPGQQGITPTTMVTAGV